MLSSLKNKDIVERDIKLSDSKYSAQWSFTISEGIGDYCCRKAYYIPCHLEAEFELLLTEEHMVYNRYTNFYIVNSKIKEFYKKLRYAFNIKYMIKDDDYFVVIDNYEFIRPYITYDKNIPF